MIQMGTILEVADNSGARRLACIKVQGGSTGDYGRIGDVITWIVSAQDTAGNVSQKTCTLSSSVEVQTWE